MRNYRCKDCGLATQATRKDAKYCASCSFLRVLTWAMKRTPGRRTCRLCQAKFLPLRVPDNYLCGPCHHDVVTGPEVQCGFCKATRRAVDPRVPVCVVCAKSPDLRSRIIAALRKGQKTRKAANAQPPT